MHIDVNYRCVLCRRRHHHHRHNPCDVDFIISRNREYTTQIVPTGPKEELTKQEEALLDKVPYTRQYDDLSIRDNFVSWFYGAELIMRYQRKSLHWTVLRDEVVAWGLVGSTGNNFYTNLVKDTVRENGRFYKLNENVFGLRVWLSLILMYYYRDIKVCMRLTQHPPRAHHLNY